MEVKGEFMRKPSCTKICFLVALLAVALSYSATVSAVDDPKAERKAFEKQVEQSIGAPVLRGDTWQSMTEDCKFAFIWGAIHVVGIELELMNKYPEMKNDSFVAKFNEAMSNMPLKEVIAKVDEYYRTHPDKLRVAVMAVVWDKMITPNI
jgi:hypothetical protein